MFQVRQSGIQQLAQNIIPVIKIVGDEATLKAALQSGNNTLANVLASLQAAATLKADLAALSKSGNPVEAAYAAGLSPKIDAVVTAISQCPIAVKDLLSGDENIEMKDGDGHTATVGNFNGSTNYSWSSSLGGGGSHPYKNVGWGCVDGNGNIHGASGINVSESGADTHGNYTMNASGAGSSVEPYAYVEMSSAASAAIKNLCNGF